MLHFSGRAAASARLGFGLLVALASVVGCGSSDAKTAGSGGNGSGGNGSGGNGSGGASGSACSSISTEADCAARADCHAVSVQTMCPGSGAACPFEFKYCSDTNCGPACSSTQLCVGSQTVGGAINNVPAPPSYSCQPKPSACGATVDCQCAASACPPSHGCQSSSPGQIECVEEVP
jgi:hypothetical protein